MRSVYGNTSSLVLQTERPDQYSMEESAFGGVSVLTKLGLVMDLRCAYEVRLTERVGQLGWPRGVRPVRKSPGTSRCREVHNF